MNFTTARNTQHIYRTSSDVSERELNNILREGIEQEITNYLKLINRHDDGIMTEIIKIIEGASI